MIIFLLIVSIISLLALIGFLLVINRTTAIYITLISLFFPIHIRVFGKDAITSGTVCIIALLLKYLLDSMQKRKFYKNKKDFFILLLIVFSGASIMIPYMTGSLETYYIGHAVRQFVGLVSSIMLFFVIKNHFILTSNHKFSEHIPFIENILSIVIIFTSVHIIISIIVKTYPSFGSYFNIFLSRDVDAFNAVNQGSIQRIQSFVFGQESYGEITAALSPIIAYKFYRYRNSVWMVCFFLFVLAMIMSVTRSGIILFMVGMMALSIFYLKTKNIKSFFLLFLFLPSIIFFLINTSILDSVAYRFNESILDYHSGKDISEVLNRDFWPEVLESVTSEISFFGHGITEYNYHNLYLTVVHQRGLIGAALFFIIILSPVVMMIKSYKFIELNVNRELAFTCIIFSVIFFINEIKFEFLRSDSYQQICWSLFAVFILVSEMSIFHPGLQNDDVVRVLEDPYYQIH